MSDHLIVVAATVWYAAAALLIRYRANPDIAPQSRVVLWVLSPVVATACLLFYLMFHLAWAVAMFGEYVLTPAELPEEPVQPPVVSLPVLHPTNYRSGV